MKAERIKIGEIGKCILGVVAVAGVVSVVAMFPGVTMIAAPFLKKKKSPHTQIVKRNIDSLMKHKLLRRVMRNGVPSVELTLRGRWEAGIRGLDRGANAPWDHVWRIIIFDIPVSKNNLRWELRRAVTLYGFRQLQKSVWVYPFPCEDFITLVKKYLDVRGEVLYMTANYIENDGELRRDFNVK